MPPESMTDHHESRISPGREATGGREKYLSFTLGGESYGVPVTAVREIIRICPITPVANMPPHVRGVINLRGKVIPVVDLRVRFGLPAAPDHDRTCIVIAQVPAASGGVRPYAVVVDGVEEVSARSAEEIVPPPDFGGAVDTRFIVGMTQREQGVTTLIDLDAIAAADATNT